MSRNRFPVQSLFVFDTGRHAERCLHRPCANPGVLYHHSGCHILYCQPDPNPVYRAPGGYRHRGRYGNQSGLYPDQPGSHNNEPAPTQRQPTLKPLKLPLLCPVRAFRRITWTTAVPRPPDPVLFQRHQLETNPARLFLLEKGSKVGPYDQFQQGYQNTALVQVTLGTISGDAGAGQRYWTVPAALVAQTTDGKTQTFAACYTYTWAAPTFRLCRPLSAGNCHRYGQSSNEWNQIKGFAGSRLVMEFRKAHP